MLDDRGMAVRVAGSGRRETAAAWREYGTVASLSHKPAGLAVPTW